MTGEEKDGAAGPAPAATLCLSDDDVLRYLEGTASGPEPAAVQAHLTTCERCRILVGVAAQDLVARTAANPSRRLRTLADHERVLGRYEIERFIARGGMGEVYLARDTFLGESVALKTLSIAIVDSAEAVARFKAEVQLARKVSHANVCRILEFGFHEQRAGDAIERIPFLTMEFLRGRTLREHIAAVGPLPLAQVEEITRQMAEGLTAIHQAGIVHRDFKSDNVLLVPLPDGQQRVVLMDFGLARPLEGRRSFSSVGGMVGTMDYMAPEQVEGKPATAAADVYALGIVVYEMLTARLPFQAESSVAATLMRLQEPAPRVTKHRADVPRAWELLVARCLERDPSRRYQTGAELRTPASQPGADRSRSRLRRPVAVVGGIAAAAVLAAVLLRGDPKPANSAVPASQGLGAVSGNAAQQVAREEAPVPVTRAAVPGAGAGAAAAEIPPSGERPPVAIERPPARRPSRTRVKGLAAPAAPKRVVESPAPPAAKPEPNRHLRHPDDVSNPFQ